MENNDSFDNQNNDAPPTELEKINNEIKSNLNKNNIDIKENNNLSHSFLNNNSKLNKDVINNILYENKIENKNILLINIKYNLLINLEKKYLIDLILFIKEHCKVTINETFTDFHHEIFKLKKNEKINGYKIYINHLEKRKLKIKQAKNFVEKNKNFIIINNEEEKNINNKNNNENQENHIKENNIIEKKYIENENKNFIYEKSIKCNENIINNSLKENEIFYCENHNKKFKTNSAYINHCRAKHRFKCIKCGILLGAISKVKEHIINCKENNINNLSNNDNKKILKNIDK